MDIYDAVILFLLVFFAGCILALVGYLVGSLIAWTANKFFPEDLPTVRSIKQCRSVKDEHATYFDHDFVPPRDRINDK